jgi:hypothetical protein
MKKPGLQVLTDKIMSSLSVENIIDNAGTSHIQATFVELPVFDFLLLFGRMTWIATASSEVLICDA